MWEGGNVRRATRTAGSPNSIRRDERTVGGYRKARHVRPLEGLDILNVAEPAHFHGAGIPVPSHWLQFGRILNVAMHLHNEKTAVFRIAARSKYPDGFTLSNQMKRLIG